MKDIITDEMVQKAFEHMNSKADPVYGSYKEHDLGNPYINAGFAVAIKELYGMEICEDMVPTLEQINEARGKNKIYVVYSQNYDVIEYIYVLSEDKFEDYIKEYNDKLIPEHNLEGKFDSIEIIRNKDSVTWKIMFTDDYISKVYHWLALEDIKRDKRNIGYYGFEFFTTEVNKYFKNKNWKL